MKRKFGFATVLAAISIVIVVSASVYFLFFSGSRKTPEIKGKAYAVTERTIRPYVSVSGEIFPDSYHELGFQTSGKIEEVYVKTGERVKKGDPLATLKNEEREISLKIAEINLKSASERLEQTKKHYELQVKQTKGKLSRTLREIEILKNDISSVEVKLSVLKEQYGENPLSQIKEEIEKLQSSLLTLKKQKEGLEETAEELKNSIENLQSKKTGDVRLSLYQLEQARLNYEKEKESMENLTLHSPADGTVLFVGLKKGQDVGSSSLLSKTGAARQPDASVSTRFNRESIVIVEDDWLPKTEVLLDQMDVVKVKAGLKAEAYLDAVPDTVLQGKVESVNLFPVQGSAGTNSYIATIAFNNRPEKLVAGMSALVKIYLEEKSGLAVPVSSLRYINGIPHVYVLSKGRIFERRVRVEDSDDSFSLVTSGLKKGEKIVADISTINFESLKNQAGEERTDLQSPSRRRPLFRIFR